MARPCDKSVPFCTGSQDFTNKFGKVEKNLEPCLRKAPCGFEPGDPCHDPQSKYCYWCRDKYCPGASDMNRCVNAISAWYPGLPPYATCLGGAEGASFAAQQQAPGGKTGIIIFVVVLFLLIMAGFGFAFYRTTKRR